MSLNCKELFPNSPATNSRRSRCAMNTFNRETRVALTLIVLLGGCVPLCAQLFSINWYEVAGGGGTSIGGTFRVSGTIGQSDAGAALIGGTYSLFGGFGSSAGGIPSPGLPSLTATRSGGRVVVFWPSAAAGFALEQNENLRIPAGWSRFRGLVIDNGVTKSVTISVAVGSVFFRLASP